jgi:hypothetical protein
LKNIATFRSKISSLLHCIFYFINCRIIVHFESTVTGRKLIHR